MIFFLKEPCLFFPLSLLGVMGESQEAEEWGGQSREAGSLP